MLPGWLAYMHSDRNLMGLAYDSVCMPIPKDLSFYRESLCWCCLQRRGHGVRGLTICCGGQDRCATNPFNLVPANHVFLWGCQGMFGACGFLFSCPLSDHIVSFRQLSFLGSLSHMSGGTALRCLFVPSRTGQDFKRPTCWAAGVKKSSVLLNRIGWSWMNLVQFASNWERE